MNRRISKSFVRQHDHSDCGVACLSSIIQYHGGEASLENLRKISGTSKEGTTLLGLLQAAQELGFDAEGMEAETISNLDELKEPAILHVLIDDRLQHYVVFYPSSANDAKPSGRLMIGDPAKGLIESTVEEVDAIWRSKVLLLLQPNEKFQHQEKTKREKQKWIMDLVKEDFNVLTISLAVGIAIAVLGISMAIFSQKLIDDILPKENTTKLILSLVLVTFLLLMRSGLSFLRGTFMLRQSLDFNGRIVQNFYGNILHLPKSFFDTRKIGELIARMSDTRRIQSVIAALFGSVAIDLLLVLASLTFVHIYSSTVGIVALVILPVYFLVLRKFSKPLAQAQKGVMANYALVESNFIDTMHGVAEIKLLNKEQFFEKQNATVFGKFQQSFADLGKLNITFGVVSDVVGVFFMMSMIGIAAFQVISKQLQLGEMVALLGMSGNIVPAVNRLVIANVQIQEAKVAFDRMFEFTSMEKEQKDNAISSFDLAEGFSVELKSVAFRFPGRKQILSDVSLVLKEGEMVALLGESAGGKSTTLQLIQKFYRPEKGMILVDGKNLEEISHKSWRSVVGCVPQEVKIFNGSLIYNIALSSLEVDFQSAISFCEEMGFGKFFNELPQKYSTLIGEEGVNLSGGQKQLVGLARALYRRPKVLLLDEATSSMDRDTENFIISLLLKEKQKIATLMVTHRMKTASTCDRIYLLKNGETSQKERFEEQFSMNLL